MVRDKEDKGFEEGTLEQEIDDQLSPQDLPLYPKYMVHLSTPQLDHQDRSLDDPSPQAKDLQPPLLMRHAPEFLPPPTHMTLSWNPPQWRC